MPPQAADTVSPVESDGTRASFQVSHRDLPMLYEYLRRRIGAGGLLLSLCIGTITGWPNGPWVPVAVGIPLLHAVYLHRAGRQPGSTTLIIDGAAIAAATLTMGIPTVTAAALCFYVVVAAVLTRGRRAMAVAAYAAVWVAVSVFWSYNELKDPYDPEAKAIIEGSATVFFAAAISLVVAAVMIQLRRTDRARSEAVGALVDSNSQLERLVESKDRFVASVSHELRTPLTAVMGLAEALNGEIDDLSGQDLSEIHSLIAGEAGEVARIVEDLLVAARADIGEVAVFPERLWLGRVCTETVKATACARDRTIVAGEAEGLADPIRVKQIVRNLLVNASRYGGDSVRIDVVDTETGVVVDVADDGPGIPDEAADRIFDPYERAENASSEVGSIGLGLAVSRTLARLMSGDLSYERRGDWSVFSLSLPRAEDRR